jgi:DNA repair exonuclease SbcCD ATPase subunit
MEQLRAAHQDTINGLKAEHAATLESRVKALEKKLSNQDLELKATQDDLAKAKASLDVARTEVESLIAQRDEARNEAAAAAASSAPDQSEEVGRLTKELSHAKDDHAALTDVLALTKASLTEMSESHSKELEEAAKGRAEEVTKLRAVHDEEVASLATQKSEMLTRLSDLEGELATLKASVAAEPPTSPKANGNGVAHLPSPGVTKEELQRMHEAHNLKLHDLQAEHEKALKALNEELDKSHSKADELQQDLARKAMEIKYLEQEQDDSQDQITRYVRFFGLHFLLGGAVASAVVYRII